MVLRIVLLLTVLAPSIQEPATQPFIGSWDLDGFYPRLPFGFHGDRAVCGARYPSALQDPSELPAPVAESEQVRVGTINGTLVVTSDAKQLVIERRYTGSAGDVSFKAAYSLDGTETTSTSDGVILRAKATISGQKLTLSGVVTASNSKESVTCSLKEVFEVSGNSLKVTAVGEANGDQLWSYQTYFKQGSTIGTAARVVENQGDEDGLRAQWPSPSLRAGQARDHLHVAAHFGRQNRCGVRFCQRTESTIFPLSAGVSDTGPHRRAAAV